MIVSLLISCEGNIDQSNRKSAVRADYRVEEWLRSRGVKEIYLYRLPDDMHNFEIKTIYLGDAGLAEEGLKNFPEGRVFAESLRKIGINRAVLIEYSLSSNENNVGAVGSDYISGQDLILIRENGGEALGGVSLEDIEYYFSEK